MHQQRQLNGLRVELLVNMHRAPPRERALTMSEDGSGALSSQLLEATQKGNVEDGSLLALQASCSGPSMTQQTHRAMKCTADSIGGRLPTARFQGPGL